LTARCARFRATCRRFRRSACATASGSRRLRDAPAAAAADLESRLPAFSRERPIAAAAAPLLDLVDVSRTFDVSPPWLDRVVARRPRASLTAVDRVSLSIARGETLGLVGESGCGKSTVARLIVGLHEPTHGRIVYDGTVLAGQRAGAREAAARRRARRSMQMIFQDPYASLNPRWRVADIVAEPIVAQSPRMPRAGVRARVFELLEQVGLAVDDAARYPHQFSGGQRQRVSIARALATQPAFIVCDEPTSALDVSVQAQVLNLMRDLQRRLALTYLFISHNLAVVRHVADRVGVMYLGRIVEIATTARLFAAARHPYTRMLLAAVPDLDSPGRARSGVAGEVPNPLDPPRGCAFHPRCPYANERCRREAPALVESAAGVGVACHAVAEGRIDTLAAAS
jgi:peptide/nickel transport system ATP-binding protein